MNVKNMLTQIDHFWGFVRRPPVRKHLLVVSYLSFSVLIFVQTVSKFGSVASSIQDAKEPSLVAYNNWAKKRFNDF